MIGGLGTALHLAARGLDLARAEVAEARRLLGWGCLLAQLGRRAAAPGASGG